MWLEYLRMEMRFIAKTIENLQVLNFKEKTEDPATAAGHDGDQAKSDANDNMVLGSHNTNQVSNEPSSDKTALKSMASTPALTGAIPIAIFDSAMKEFDGDSALAEQMFDIVAEFPSLTSCQKILKHVMFVLGRQVPATANWAMCSFKLPLVGIKPTSHKFPMALRHALQLLRAAIVQQRRTQTKYEIAERAALELSPMTFDPEVDPEIQKVIASVLKQTVMVLGSGTRLVTVIETLQKEERLNEARPLLKLGLKQDASSKALQRKYTELEGPKKRGKSEKQVEVQQPVETSKALESAV